MTFHRPAQFERMLIEQHDTFLDRQFGAQSARNDASGLIATIEGYLEVGGVVGNRLALEAIRIWREAAALSRASGETV